jgi:two-component system response regulator GlrR
MKKKGRTVLLVDDDQDLVFEMRIRLEAAGFQVATAHSEREARQALEGLRPDVAVVDLMMEEHDSGFTLCHTIKKKDASLPVILLTAVASETGIDFDAVTPEERAWVKAETVLDKPVRFETLLAEIERLLSRSEAGG